MFESSNRPQHRAPDFSKPDSSRSSFRPIREEGFDKELDADSRKIESEERKPNWSGLSSVKDGDKVNVTASSFRSTTTQSTPSSEPITETSRTNVSCIATPALDRNGNPVIETITKTQREINGQPLPTETIKSKIPVEEIQALQQGQQQPRLTSLPLEQDEIENEGFESAASESSLPRQRHSSTSSLKEGAKHASEAGSELLHQAKEWVNETAPKAKEALSGGAAASYEWVETNAPKAKVWVETTAPKVQRWAEHQIHDVQDAARKIDTRKIKPYLPRKELLPLLASVLLALVLGTYLYRNAGRLGLTGPDNSEAIVPLQPDPLHQTLEAERPGHFTAYPQNRDYYQHEHVPHRMSELEEKLSAAAKAGLHSASSNLHSATSQTQQAASQTKQTVKDTVHHAADYVQDKVELATDYVQDKVGHLEESLRERAGEMKEHLHGYADAVQHQARKVQSEAEGRTKEGVEKGKEALNDAKARASDLSESAKIKLNEATEAARSKIHEAAASASASTQSIRHGHPQETLIDEHTQSPAGQGPYDEPNTPPHAHTYEHTLRGAAEYLKDKVGEGLHSLGKRTGNAMPPAEPLR